MYGAVCLNKCLFSKLIRGISRHGQDLVSHENDSAVLNHPQLLINSLFIGDEKKFYGWMKRTKKGCACIL